MPPSQPDSILVQLAHALERAPKYGVDYVVGFIIVALTDPLMTSLFLGCFLLSLTTSYLIGGTVLLLAYTAVRMVNNVANAIGIGGQTIATAIRPPLAPPTMAPPNMNRPSSE